jgi:hypothetical protein
MSVLLLGHDDGVPPLRASVHTDVLRVLRRDAPPSWSDRDTEAFSALRGRI